VDGVCRALTEHHIAAHRLELEITETTLTDTTNAAPRLTALRALGLSTAIDDFGTGYTSIGQLPALPFDTLKTDRSFVGATHESHRNLTALMIEAAHAFQLTVIVEGVEDTSVLDTLRGLGCDSAQGFLLARPMPAAEVPAWLATSNSHTRSALLPGTGEREARLVPTAP
jgi:EAL domain-containing protein (putative c-di-GMP-specific phosphodiesterase class I)